MKTLKLKPKRCKGWYKSAELTVDLSDCDTDITINLPNGEKYMFQYRNEGPSVDLCIGKEGASFDGKPTWENLQKACYLEDGEMAPGKRKKNLPANCRMAAQIVIL